MKAPTENGYYWIRFACNHEWIIVEAMNPAIYLCGNEHIYRFSDVEEWWNKIERLAKENE